MFVLVVVISYLAIQHAESPKRNPKI